MRSLASYMEVARQYLVQTSADFSPAASWDDRFEAYRTWCLALKMLAYGKLLVDCDEPAFHAHLLCAAVNWRELLTRARAEGHQVPASMNDPLLGAIASGRRDLALELAELSARELTEPEYEDEFLGAFFLQEYLRARAGRTDTADLERLCQDIDEYLDEPSPRTDTFRALARGDGPAFNDAFRTWNETVATTLSDPDAPGATFSFGITRHVWLEGLAVLRLASGAGLPLEPVPRPHLPELILQPPLATPAATPWLLGQTRLTEEDEM
ncbi:immunity 49 family protein [Myxococcus sp. RHSTA-1-4]|uniref:immunity 49 family protein n=1 Tax=Myxococcus sp. RHSTA-1-4 TaxID=2874601 RepID=UPI001CBAA17E|nr:immunity 49 family protein [Myxococcus sp. RHSTA-1-4]MBZ4422599.1 immunity 49 family protein [Myxococcus sp. RHSTA-1-4]